MAASTRSAQFTRLHKILKKHYTPVAPAPNRSVLEHLLFAACLENAHYRVAEEMFGALVHTFFDWNEIRVSSVRELSEVLAGLPDPAAAGFRVKRILQDIFEATYAFDLEDLRKLNLGPAVERLEKIEGTTKFSIAYVIQAALGGHAIPIDAGTANALRVVNLASDADVAAGVIAGLERAIPKPRGVEFGSLLHQLGADFTASPYSPALHAILLEIDPSAKDRLPSRRGPRRVPAETTAAEDGSAKAAAEAPKGVAEPAKTVAAPSESKAAPSKPGKAAAKAAASESAPSAGQLSSQAPVPDTKTKPAQAKRKSGGDPPVLSQAPNMAEAPAPSEKKKSPSTAKKPPRRKKTEPAKEKDQADSPRDVSEVEEIAKRKPR